MKIKYKYYKHIKVYEYKFGYRSFYYSRFKLANRIGDMESKNDGQYFTSLIDFLRHILDRHLRSCDNTGEDDIPNMKFIKNQLYASYKVMSVINKVVMGNITDDYEEGYVNILSPHGV